MKNILVLFIFLCILFSCSKENISADYVYSGPNPSIEMGTNEAQNLCYTLYKKYDLHVYYNLNGDDALKTPLGYVSVNNFKGFPGAYPVVEANGDKAAVLLDQIIKLYSFFSDDIVKKSLFKRIVLVKVVPTVSSNSNLGNLFFKNSLMEPNFGTLIYGGLSSEDVLNVNLLRKSIIYNLMYSMVEKSNKKVDIPKYFSSISKEYYRNNNYYLCFDYAGLYLEDVALSCGFVSPDGAKCSREDYCNNDMASFAEWIISTSQIEINDICSKYNLIEAKRLAAIKFFKDYYNIDLENINKLFNTL